MKKIVQRTRGFEKAFGKLFIKKLHIFIDDEFSPSLKTHRLKGKRKNEYSFSVTDDIRAIYTKRKEKEKEILIFTFIDVGAHSKVY